MNEQPGFQKAAAVDSMERRPFTARFHGNNYRNGTRARANTERGESNFRHGLRWWQFSGRTHGFESLHLMLTVAEGLVGGVSAAAKRKRRAAAEAELVAVLIDHGEIAFDANRTVVKYDYL